MSDPFADWTGSRVHHKYGTYIGTMQDFLADEDWAAWQEQTYTDPYELMDEKGSDECKD